MNKSRRHHGFVYGYGVKRHFQQYLSYIVAVSVLLEGTRVPGKPTCRLYTIAAMTRPTFPHTEETSYSHVIGYIKQDEQILTKNQGRTPKG
jgi:hypothetical protein